MTPDNLSAKDVEAAEKYAPNRGERPNCSGHARDGFLAGISHARAQMEGSKGELAETILHMEQTRGYPTPKEWDALVNQAHITAKPDEGS